MATKSLDGIPFEIIPTVQRDYVYLTVPTPTMEDSNAQTTRTWPCINQRYVIVHENLGFGSYGIVKAVVDRHNHMKMYAMKVAARDVGWHEVEIFRRINGHPNIVQLHAVLDDPANGDVMLILEYMEGGVVMELTTQQSPCASPNSNNNGGVGVLLNSTNSSSSSSPGGKYNTGGSHSGGGGVGGMSPLSESQVRQYMAQLSAALRHIHERSVTHGDIKPTNMYTSADRMTVKLADFGCAQVVRDRCGSGDAIKVVVGTPSFFPPEVVRAGDEIKYGFAQDMWALGVTMYIMLYGKLPFSTEKGVLALQEAVANDPVMYPHNDSVSDACLSVLTRLLTKDPQARMSVSELCNHFWITGGESPVAEHDKLKEIVRSASFNMTPVKSSMRMSFHGSPLHLAKGFRILVADESGASRAYTTKLISTVIDTNTRHPVTVVVVSDGAETIRVATTTKFDLVLMDIHMLQHNGFEAAHAIRQHEEAEQERNPGAVLQRAWIVGITGDCHQSILQYCQLTGMSELLRKPVSVEKIRSICVALEIPVVSRETTRKRNNSQTTPSATLTSVDGDECEVPTLGIEKMLEKVERTERKRHKVFASVMVCALAFLSTAASKEHQMESESPTLNKTATPRLLPQKGGYILHSIDQEMGSGGVLPLSSSMAEFDDIVAALEESEAKSRRAMALHALCSKEQESYRRENFLNEIAAKEAAASKVHAGGGVGGVTGACFKTTSPLASPAAETLSPPPESALHKSTPSLDGSRPLTPHDPRQHFKQSRRRRPGDIIILPASPKPHALSKTLSSLQKWSWRLTPGHCSLIHEAHSPIPGDCHEVATQIATMASEIKDDPHQYPLVICGTAICSRPSMEDVVCVLPHVSRLHGVESVQPEPDMFIAVLDGHDGVEAAMYVDHHLHDVFVRDPCFLTNPSLAMRNAFHNCNASFLNNAQKHECPAGATAVVAYLRGKSLVIANAGDCTAVAYRKNGTIEVLTKKHDTQDEDEVAQVIQRGGEIIQHHGKRVNGRLLVTRAFGNFRDRTAISCDPDIVTIDDVSDYNFVVFGTDGLWNLVTPKQICPEIAETRKDIDDRVLRSDEEEKETWHDIPQALVHYILASSSPEVPHFQQQQQQQSQQQLQQQQQYLSPYGRNTASSPSPLSGDSPAPSTSPSTAQDNLAISILFF